MELPKPIKWETIRLGVMIPWGLPQIYRRTWETFEDLEKPPCYKLFFGTGRTPARRHEIGCEEALRWGASHILILGGDQTYPEPDTIKRMFKWLEVNTMEEWMERKKVINCLVPIRGHRPGQGTRPFQPIGMYLDPDTQELMPIRRDGPKLIKAEIIGTGVMLFESSALKGMDKPWFGDEHMPQTNEVKTMQDVAFVKKLNNMGYQSWCDTRIIVKHIGEFEIDDTWQWRFD